VVHRRDLRGIIAKLCRLLTKAPASAPAPRVLPAPEPATT
jgi:hypothetical protein